MDDLAAQNPSYANYLAKQMLANPKVHGLITPAIAAEVEQPTTDDSNSQKLGSLLDVIDSSKRKGAPEDTADEQVSVAQVPVAASSSSSSSSASATSSFTSSPYDWIKQFDASTGHFYYYNYKTAVSQWEMPDGFVETAIPYQPPAPLADPSAFAATFNQKTGSFSNTGTQSYWEQVGRATDREGRQMSGKTVYYFVPYYSNVACFSFF
jgi:hypothetical protein